MNAESIVVSLEWAKRLKEVGYPQSESIFQWKGSFMQFWLVLRQEVRDKLFPPQCFDGLMETANMKTYLSTPTFEEITEKFRDEDGDIPNVQIRKKWYRLHMNWDFFSLLNIENDDDCLIQFPRDCRHDSMADLAAQVYCYLAENNLLPPPHDS